MKYKYRLYATQTHVLNGYLEVVASSEEEARTIANESEEWDWDDNYPVFEIVQVKRGRCCHPGCGSDG